MVHRFVGLEHGRIWLSCLTLPETNFLVGASVLHIVVSCHFSFSKRLIFFFEWLQYNFDKVFSTISLDISNFPLYLGTVDFFLSVFQSCFNAAS